jgi:3-methyladenine DNA glycosylase/8-oxoguanine DNA glycosylase
VREAAEALRKHGISTAADIGLGNTETVQRVLLSIPGIGGATASYFLMLLGAPGVKPDRMVHRFLSDAAGHAFSNTQAEEVIKAAAGRLSVQSHVLDHAIWRYESTKAASPPGP